MQKRTDIDDRDLCRLLLLSDDLLRDIFSSLDPATLAVLSCTCLKLNDLTENNDLWREVCDWRWHKVHYYLTEAVDVTQADQLPSLHYSAAKRLYCRTNGWRQPVFDTATIRTTDHFVSAVAQRPLDGDNSLQFAFATSTELQVWNVSAEARPLAERISGGCQCPSAEYQTVYSLEYLDPGTTKLAAGTSGGELVVYGPDPGGQAGLHPLSKSYVAGINSPIVDIHIIPQLGQLVALHDATFAMEGGAQQRNWLRVLDAESLREVARLSDCLDSYELVAACPLAPAAPGGVRSNELVAGSVHGEFCANCFNLGIPSLCRHKSQAHSAALCVFDLRQPAMAQRFGMYHRSLFPLIRTVRERYILTSHVGQPLGVWDLRFMSAPLHEEEHLNNWPACPTGLPFGAPSRPAEHQALWLDTDGDALIGRAENGMLWLWDLSATLGWARGPGPSPASWQRMHSDGPSSRHYDEGTWRFRDWPTPLGSLPCETALPTTLMPGGTAVSLLCLCADAADSVDYLHLSRLSTPLGAVEWEARGQDVWGYEGDDLAPEGPDGEGFERAAEGEEGGPGSSQGEGG